jgi:hypothetical protein
VRLNTKRYGLPKMNDWRINDKPVAAEGDLPITVQAECFDGLNAFVSSRDYTIHYKVVDSGLDVTANSLDGNFSVIVSCSVTETAITGNNINTPTAIPGIEVDFKCAETLREQAYITQLEACLTAQAQRFNQKYKPRGKPGRGEPINFISELLKEGPLPAYVRPSEYAQIRLVTKAVRAINAMMPPEMAQQYTRSLLRHFPALQMLAAKQERGSAESSVAE